MVINFNSIKVHNFCSYIDAQIDLSNRGFCAVYGQNLCKTDNAYSNGSGKSTIWSAICFALTGETILGIKSNLKNINAEDADSFVELDLFVDKDHFVITRSISPKSDLKIIKNDVDISGKSITESKKILSETLADISKDLIASTIILGQGMPNKFSSFSPSGRKELLERLTKSDFMIEDIKNRIYKRQSMLSSQIRSVEDSLLICRSQLSMTKEEVRALENEVNSYDNDSNKAEELLALKKHLENLQNQQKQDAEQEKLLQIKMDELMQRVNQEIDEKSKVSSDEYKNYTDAYSNELNNKNSLQMQLEFVQKELQQLNDIKDICPTCGQRIPGVLKPNTQEQQEKINTLIACINQSENRIIEICSKHEFYLLKIDEQYASIATNQEEIKKLKLMLNSITEQASCRVKEINETTALLNKAIFNNENYENTKKQIKRKLEQKKTQQNQLLNEEQVLELSKIDLDTHFATIRKIDNLVKRDFRGYLLLNIIEYLNIRAKEFASKVFNTTALDICLNNNNLDIVYCNKPYEILSGGEKQRIDIILQFVIRDLLQTYFNYSANILVLDEITDNLDRLATEKIFDLIVEKFQDVESIFIISHHDEELALPIDSEIFIIKDENSISSIR